MASRCTCTVYRTSYMYVCTCTPYLNLNSMTESVHVRKCTSTSSAHVLRTAYMCSSITNGTDFYHLLITNFLQQQQQRRSNLRRHLRTPVVTPSKPTTRSTHHQLADHEVPPNSITIRRTM